MKISIFSYAVFNYLKVTIAAEQVKTLGLPVVNFSTASYGSP